MGFFSWGPLIIDYAAPVKIYVSIIVILSVESSDGHPEAIQPIQDDMNQQPDSQKTRLWKYRNNQIQCNGGIRVQGMEAQAAAVRIENRIGHQVVQIDEQGTQHHHPG